KPRAEAHLRQLHSLERPAQAAAHAKLAAKVGLGAGGNQPLKLRRSPPVATGAERHVMPAGQQRRGRPAPQFLTAAPRMMQQSGKEGDPHIGLLLVNIPAAGARFAQLGVSRLPPPAAKPAGPQSRRPNPAASRKCSAVSPFPNAPWLSPAADAGNTAFARNS